VGEIWETISVFTSSLGPSPAPSASANIADARRIAAQADAVRERRPDLSLLFAVAALKIAPVDEARRSLAQTLEQSRFAGLLPGHRGQINRIAANPAGKGIATASADGTVALWDITDRLHRVRLSTIGRQGGPVVLQVAFDRRGKLLAAATDHATQLWDVSDLSRPRMLAQIDDVETVRFSPTRDVLFAGTALWDVANPARPVKFASIPVTAAVRDADINEDGTILTLATAPENTTMWTSPTPGAPPGSRRCPSEVTP
jgi:WD40 repeat protein